MTTKELLIEKMCKVNTNYTKSFLNDVITDIEITKEYGGTHTKVNFIRDGNVDNVSVISGCSNQHTYYDFSVNGQQYVEEDGYYGDFLKQLAYIFERHMINFIDVMKCLHGYETVKYDFEEYEKGIKEIKEISEVTSQFVYNIPKPESNVNKETNPARHNFQKYALQKCINLAYKKFANNIEYKFKNDAWSQ